MEQHARVGLAQPEAQLQGARDAALEDVHTRIDTSQADEALTALARACLQEDPASRPRDAGVLAGAVSAWRLASEQRSQDAVLEAASERLRATHERRARRLTLALASAVVALLALLGGLYVWRQSARASIETSVRPLLEDAAAIRGKAEGASDVQAKPGLWTDVIATLERAQQRLERGGIDSGTVHAQILSSLEGARLEESRAKQAAAVATRDRNMLARLEQLREPRDWLRLDSAAELDRVARAYGEAFAAYGVDAESEEVETVARKMRGKGNVTDALAVSIDDWIAVSLRATPDGERGRAKRLAEIADAFDSDAWRRRLRKALLEGDQAALMSLSQDEARETQPLRALVTLAESLRGRDARKVGARLVREAGRRASVPFYYHHVASKLLGIEGDLLGALTTLRRALELRPEHMWTSLLLAEMLEIRGDYIGAVGALRRARELAKAQSIDVSSVDFDRRIARSEKNRTEEAAAWSKFAQSLYEEGAYRRSMTAFGRAHMSDRGLVEYENGEHGYIHALCSVALGTKSEFPDKEKAFFRKRAYDWLGVTAAQCRSTLEGKRATGTEAGARAMLKQMLEDPRLDAVRSPDGLQKLPAGESASWRRLWRYARAGLGRGR